MTLANRLERFKRKMQRHSGAVSNSTEKSGQALVSTAEDPTEGEQTRAAEAKDTSEPGAYLTGSSGPGQSGQIAAPSEAVAAFQGLRQGLNREIARKEGESTLSDGGPRVQTSADPMPEDAVHSAGLSEDEESSNRDEIGSDASDQSGSTAAASHAEADRASAKEPAATSSGGTRAVGAPRGREHPNSSSFWDVV